MTSDDLATADGVRGYVAATPFACTDVSVLSGGLGNYTFRLRLVKPYQGQETVVLKHGKAWLPADRSFELPLYRQKYEVESMRGVRASLPEGSLATTPEIYLFDEVAHVIVMEDAGVDSVTLKDLLLKGGTLAPALAGKIGSALGAFIAHAHTWGRNPDVVRLLAGNTFARVVSAWITYGRVISTVTAPSDDLAALRDPLLDISAEDLAALSKVADSTADAVRNAHERGVHGDFWTGNVMVRFSGAGIERDVARVYVVDWELAKLGLPGIDLGQFSAEVHQARTFFPHCEPAAAALMKAFLTAYRDAADGEDMVETARVALTHVGAHIATWTPRTPTWRDTDREKVRMVVMQGVQYMLEAGKEGYNHSESVFGPLLEQRP